MRKSLTRLCVSILALSTAQTALAQDQAGDAADTSGGGDVIVVTAQFREQNLQDTPLAITAVNAEMLEARSQTDISQVANQAPSVTLKAQGAAYGPSIAANIRGVGQYDFNPALEPGVGLYVDDVYYATLTGSVLDLLDLERVEILRGPQGTLAGRNSIGGAIKLYSKRPEGTNSGSLQGTYGSRNRIDLRGSADFNLADGIDARLAGVAKKQEGYVDRLDFGCVYPMGGSATLPSNAPLNAGQPVNPATGGIPATRTGDCKVADEGNVNYMGLRGQLRFRPSDTIDINISADYTIDDRWQVGSVLLETYYPNGTLASPHFPFTTASPPYVTAPTNATRDINPYGPGIAYDTRFVCGKFCNFASYTNDPDNGLPRDSAAGRIKFEGWGLAGQLDWDLSEDLKLTSITAYRDYISNFENDNDTSPMAHSLGYGPLTFHFFSQELRLNGAIGADNMIEYTVGAYYSDQKSVYTSFQGLRGSGLRFEQSDPVKLTSKAVFANVTWNATEALSLNGGVRYTDEKKTYQYVRRGPNGTPAPAVLAPLDGKVGVSAGDRVDWRIALQYRWNDALMTYAQVSTGYKGGGVNPRPFFPQQVLPFGPETLDSYEVGFKTDLFDRRVRFNLAGFWSKYHDIQLTLTNCTVQAGTGFGAPCALPVNAGEAEMKGVEAESTIRLFDGLLIDGSLAYLDFDYKEFASFSTGTGSVSVGGPTVINAPQFGDYPAFTPRWKWSLGAQYEWRLGSGAGSLIPRLDYAHQGMIHTNATNRDSNRIEPYSLFNARLTWRNEGGDLDVALEVTNLFDEYYYLSINDQSTGAQGYTNAQPGRPREWAVTVKKKF